MDTKLTFDIEADELEIFLDEVNEHMQVMESGILELERTTDAALVNAVFRAAHTIKALAGTVGHHQMADITHTMENIFDAMRTQQLVANQAIIDDLLGAVDVLKTLRDEIITQEASGIDITATLSALKAVAGGQPAASPNGAHAASRLSPAELALVEQARQKNRLVFEAEVTTGPDTFAPAARLMQAAMALEEAGQVVGQHPNLTQLANGEHNGKLWAVVVANNGSSAEIEALLADVSDLAGFEVRPYSLPPAGQTASQPVAPQENGKSPKPAAKTELVAEKTVRISVERLDALMNLVGELVTNRNRLQLVEDELRSLHGKEEVMGQLNETSTHMGRVVDQLQEEVMRARMLPISSLFDKFPRIVRDVARVAGKQVNLVIEGGTTELDRSLIEVIGDPLIHLLRNAVDHGIEPPAAREVAGKPATGTVNLSAAHVEGQIVISIVDDGRGIDPDKVRRAAIKRGLLTEERAAQLSDAEAIDLIFEPNLSTAEKVTDVSGRGVGMDVVRTNVERLSGAVEVDSALGKGTTFRVTLPLTLAIVDTMLVQLSNGVFAIPLTSINDVLYLSEVQVSTLTGQQAIRWRGSVLPLIDLRKFFADPRMPSVDFNDAKRAIVSVAWGKQKSGLVVDRIIGKQGIVVKSLSRIMGELPGISGGTILGDGRIALIIDVPSLMNAALRARRGSIT